MVSIILWTLPLSLRREVITKCIEKGQLSQTQVKKAKGDANRHFKIMSQAYYSVTSLVLSSQEMDECRLPNITCWKKWRSCIGCNYRLASIYDFSSLMCCMVWLWHSGAPCAFAVLQFFFREKKAKPSFFDCNFVVCMWTVECFYHHHSSYSE
ncbi:hypothetical protein PVAP13_8KG292002 [Panicum virgatum]|uniref:Uncharacterized protein n=1 Tax=Panicum virgatum TaxID=38727 RepID=A0A8T0PLF3_PANVG|nr:hypothetical protein PVAP13_8KG292002 [Panicum virgatum]